MIDDNARGGFARAKGVPADLASCHTAVIDGLVFEGHVPIADMKRLLAQRPGASPDSPFQECRSAHLEWKCQASEGSLIPWLPSDSQVSASDRKSTRLNSSH